MPRYIDTEKADKIIEEKLGIYDTTELKEILDKFPTEDVAPVIHAHWIKHDWAEESDDIIIPNYECSNCHSWFRDEQDYCGDCGAKMDEEESK